MKKLIIFLVMLALMLAPISCFAQAAASTSAESVTTEVTTEAETEAATEAESFMFEPYNFVDNLKYMLSGMVGILVVIGLIVTVTVILNKVTGRGGKNK
ncbi:MAG: hypothetical protein E7589_04585 [Ruminococcaceae bacterium]|nr:hypothetical protein [Oscillospiraceae bacterium]